jgi:hypothetical protein
MAPNTNANTETKYPDILRSEYFLWGPHTAQNNVAVASGRVPDPDGPRPTPRAPRTKKVDVSDDEDEWNDEDSEEEGSQEDEGEAQRIPEEKNVGAPEEEEEEWVNEESEEQDEEQSNASVTATGKTGA